MATDKRPVTAEEIRAARNAYARDYRAANKERIYENHKRWRDANKDKIKAYAENHWRRMAEKMRGDESGT